MNACMCWLLPGVMSSAFAAGPPVEPWQVRAELQIVHLDESRAVSLIGQFTDEAEQAGAKLRRMLADGTATLAAHLIGNAGNNDRGVAEQITEKRYRMEFYPGDPAMNSGKITRKQPDFLHFPALSSERREIGNNFEFEPFVHPGGALVRMAVSLDRNDDSGEQRFESGVRRDGGKLGFELPVTHNRTIKTNILLRPGTPALIGSCRLKAPRNLFELHVLTARIRPLEAAVPEKGGEIDPRNEGQNPPPVISTQQTRIELHRFIVPEMIALKLRAQLLDPSGIDSAFSTLIAGAKSRRWELAELLSLPAITGTRAVFENSRWQMYPTEFSQPQGPAGPNWVQPPALPENPPTAFERREIGDILETDFTADAHGGPMGLELRYETTGTRGFTRALTGTDPLTQSEHTYAYRPNVLCGKSQTTVPLADRRRVLLRFNKLPAPDGRIEIVLFRPVIENFAPDSKP
jgi:hypothetical protein